MPRINLWILVSKFVFNVGGILLITWFLTPAINGVIVYIFGIIAWFLAVRQFISGYDWDLLVVLWGNWCWFNLFMKALERNFDREVSLFYLKILLLLLHYFDFTRKT